MENTCWRPERVGRTRALALVYLLLGLGVGAVGGQVPEEPAAYRMGLLARLPEAPAWNEWLRKTGEMLPLSPLAPRAAYLPDPLRFVSGQPVRTQQDWKRRRAEIRRLYEHWITGSWPPPPRSVSARETGRSQGERATVVELRLSWDGRKDVSLGLRLYIPDGPGPFPVFLGPAWTQEWARIALRRGYLCAIYAGSDSWDDAKALQAHYPEYDFTLIARRAWAGARVLDYLQSVPAADMTRVVTAGHSRDGKQALLLAAFDERIRAVIPSSSGTFGANPFRFTGERYFSESLERKTRWDPEWFHPRSRFFAGQEHRLPVDQNLLLAMVAPRACLLSQALHDDNDPPWGAEQAYLSANQVYEWMGVNGKLGIRWRDQLHGTHARDIEDYFDWFDLQTGRASGAWRTELIWGFRWDRWRQQTGEKAEMLRYPPHGLGVTGAPAGGWTAESWRRHAENLRDKVRWLLGDPPPALRAAAPSARLPVRLHAGAWRRDLFDDLVLFAIRERGHYGWNAPPRDRVHHQQIGFGDNLLGEVFWPQGAEAQSRRLPAVIWLHGYSHATGAMWAYRPELNPILALVEAGYVVLAFDQQGFGTRIREASRFYDRYPRWSRMGQMVEDVRSGVDFLGRVEMVDPERISLYGFSLGGAVALFTAALDPRIAGAVSVCGFTPLRGDRVARGTEGAERYSHLHGLIPRIGFFAGQEERIPTDFADLLALTAPRPVIVIAPDWDRHAHAEDITAAVRSAAEVYAASGAAGRLELRTPRDVHRLSAAVMEESLRRMAVSFR
jgi:dienelactone hydrolase